MSSAPASGGSDRLLLRPPLLVTLGLGWRIWGGEREDTGRGRQGGEDRDTGMGRQGYRERETGRGREGIQGGEDRDTGRGRQGYREGKTGRRRQGRRMEGGEERDT